MTVVAVVILVGCSGGSGSSKTASPTTTPVGGPTGPTGSPASLKAFQDCLAQHGVTIPSTTPGATFPAGGPGAGGAGGGGGPAGGLGGSGAPSAAIQACQSLAPAGFGSGAAGQQALQAFVSCMSDHGVKLTATNPAVLSTVDRTSSAYKACSALLPSGAPPTTPTTTTP